MKNNEITLVIPSYNEVESISILINGINKELPTSKIIIVDDSILTENKKIKKIAAYIKNIRPSAYQRSHKNLYKLLFQDRYRKLCYEDKRYLPKRQFFHTCF